MVAPVAALRRVAERQKEALVTAREVLQAQVAPGREAQWLARQVADRHLVVQCDLLLDEALVVEDVGDPRDRRLDRPLGAGRLRLADPVLRSEEHTSELQSLMRISYAVFCLKKKTSSNHSQSHLLLTSQNTHFSQKSHTNHV